MQYCVPGTCVDKPNSVCVPTFFASMLYYRGGQPVGFAREMSQAISNWDWNNVAGFQSISRIEVAVFQQRS